MTTIIEGFLQASNLIITLDPELIKIVAVSVYVSLSATIIAAVISLPIAGFIHFRQFRGKRAIIILIQTLYSIPTVVVGLLLYLLISNAGPFGFLHILWTPEGIILGQTVLITPILLGLFISAFKSIDAKIGDLLISLGASFFQKVIECAKEARFAIISAVLIGFGRAIAEVGVAMMIGGNIKNETRVLTTTIVLDTGIGEFGFAIALGLILLTIAFIVIILINTITSNIFENIGNGGANS